MAKRYGVNPKAIAKWESRNSVSDLRTGPKEPRSTVLTVEEEAVVSPSGGIRCCRSATASTRFKRHNSASDALVAASLPAAPWDLPAAARGPAPDRPFATSKSPPLSVASDAKDSATHWWLEPPFARLFAST